MGLPIVYVDLDGVLAKFPENLDEINISISDECRQWCNETGEHHSDFEGIFRHSNQWMEPMKPSIV